jgi:hypothetical protein
MEEVVEELQPIICAFPSKAGIIKGKLRAKNAQGPEASAVLVPNFGDHGSDSLYAIKIDPREAPKDKASP